MEIVFVTSSKNKLEEARGILGFDIKSREIDLKEVQSLSVEEVAKEKVMQAYRILRVPVVVEDTGLHINGLNGFPGALIKWFIVGFDYEGICRTVDMCRDRSAYGETCVAFYDGKRLRTFIGRVNGRIAMHPNGNRRFGWDYVFIPRGYSKVFAEMTIADKNKISMRAKAFTKLKKFLKEQELIK